MTPADVLGVGLLGIRTRPLRAALSALGISLGIATLILVTGIPASSQAALLDRLTALGTNMLRAEPQPNQTPPVVLPESAVGSVRRIGPVTTAAAVANTHAVVRRSDRVDPQDGSGLAVLAASPDLLPALNGTVQSGRFDASDLPVVALGYVAAARLGIPRVVPGQPPPVVLIGTTWYTVTGVLAPMPLAPDVERAVLVGWGSAKWFLGFDGHPTVVYVKAREDAIADVRAVLPATLNPSLPGLVQVSRPSDALAAKQATQTAFSALFLGLAGVALLVGGVGVANTMFVSVLERRREIGLRRALGATRGHIRDQFLTEAVALSGLGGCAGTVLGVLVTLGYTTYQGWPPVIPLPAVAGGVLGALVVGGLAGLHPSLRAARMPPTQALA
ncbi:ABC transporter permease [Amycolatopsis sp. NBRC 101858]|uniref:ABC transporter permease n=1 Tax=Amycolatopsis sp. NBRC 101858 TaxID=3032200 RepID=UPI0024A34AFE|nr:ABC transporter permease [Amycolatopsis sp. NBRC 101858]GLY34621.1 ABC transporter permease [Amycolatopsis sp. NBRC 101858]